MHAQKNVQAPDRRGAAPVRGPLGEAIFGSPDEAAEKSAVVRERVEDRDHSRSDDYCHHRGQHEDDQRK